MCIMNENKITFKINRESDIPKYQQLVNSLNDAIAKNLLTKGDLLPSVNSICKENKLSKDTVFKAYSILKEQRVIESVPNKGYYVAVETRKILLVLDTFKAYKEVFYHSFINNLPENFIVDVQFHHYHLENFKNIINNSIGKYYKYVVMDFNHSEKNFLSSKIPNVKLLLIDWGINATPANNYVFQDFGKAFYDSLLGAVESFKKYKAIHFVYPSFTHHPIETVAFFEKYCTDFNFNYKIITNPKELNIQIDTAYISVSDRILGQFLEECQEKNLEPGKDVGFLSYNETPMKKFIYKGISVVSTDFKVLGLKSAEFITNGEKIQHYITTQLILRESL
jgi:DNA-binding transcriptional regulator YhcF (GntR family)